MLGVIQMCQNKQQLLHYYRAYMLLITRVEQVIMQLECGEEDVSLPFVRAALTQALQEAEDAACKP